MKKLSLVVFSLIIAAGTAFAVTELTTPEVYSWRYKIAIEVETPEGIKSGSAVRELRALKNNQELLPQVPPFNFEVVGEAIIIDLGERGKLFGLVGWRADLLGSFADVFEPHPRSFQSITTSLNHDVDLEPGTSRPFDREIWFVAFRDIEDPQSILTIEPEAFNEFFGDGVKLKSKTITIVDEPVSFGAVEDALSWIEYKRMGIGKWDPSRPDQAKYLTKNDLIQKGNF